MWGPRPGAVEPRPLPGETWDPFAEPHTGPESGALQPHTCADLHTLMDENSIVQSVVCHKVELAEHSITHYNMNDDEAGALDELESKRSGCHSPKSTNTDLQSVD